MAVITTVVSVYCAGQLFSIVLNLWGVSFSSSGLFSYLWECSKYFFYLLQDGSVGNLDDLAQEFSQDYSNILNDISERMDELQKREVIHDAETVNSPIFF